MIHHLSASVLARLPVSVARALVHRLGQSSKDEGPRPKQLLVDVSEVIQHDARSGIQRVVRGILLQLFAEPPVGYLIRPVFAERNQGYRYAPISSVCLQAGEEERRNAEPVVAAAGDTFLGLDLAAHQVPRHQAQLLRWKRQGVRISFLVYDLLPLLHPQWFKPVRYKTFNRWMRSLAIYADDLICISETVKCDLHRWLTDRYSLRESTVKLHTIPLGADIEATMPSAGCTFEEQAVLDQLQARQFILMVGTLEPRKGYADALSAFEQLWAEGHQETLVIVGKPGWKTETLQERLRTHKERKNRLYWFDNASDELLQELYKASLGVLLASEAEGFGLPMIEALQHEKPVLARDISVFREIAGQDTEFFNSDSFVEHLGSWMQLLKKHESSSLNAHQTSWAESADYLVEIVTKTA
jgi:glycosyltransferase involved in cell wall biosynthesis